MAEKYFCMRVTQLNATTFEKLDKFTLLTHNLEVWNLKIFKNMLYQSFYAQDDILRENNPSFKISPFLTNKEALTVLCSVRCKAHTTGSG